LIEPEAAMAEIKIFSPDVLGKPLGQYSIIGADDFDAQCAQVFANIETALKSVGAGWGNVVEFTTYLVHSQDIPKFMTYRKREFPKFFPDGAYPPNTLLMVDRLVQEPFLVEVKTIAAL
jgi:enamine deaminase RidA (YjgF/YER057c/UK114 family)